ncbi:MAG: DUF2905 domain-containing protein [Nitrospira sp. WS238]|nr:DUF2905 domain-containing protein [Nitrospira sp. WS238]
MPEWATFGKLLIGVGVGIVVLGVLVLLADRMPALGNFFGWFGKLPGDISIKRENFSFYFPIGTSIALSILLSLLFYFIGWLLRR